MADVADPELPEPSEANGRIIEMANNEGVLEIIGTYHSRGRHSILGGNEATRRTSIRSRGRRVTSVVYKDALTPEALFNIAVREVSLSVQPARGYCASGLLLNPLLWQRDTIIVEDKELGIDKSTFNVRSWTMPLAQGGFMELKADSV